jgi:hypothetical protein
MSSLFKYVWLAEIGCGVQYWYHVFIVVIYWGPLGVPHLVYGFISVCFCLFSATITIFQSWWTKLEDSEKTTDLSQVTDKVYRIMLYPSPWSRFELTTSVVICTDCISSCKSNYHTSTATTTPHFLLIVIFIISTLYIPFFYSVEFAMLTFHYKYEYQT